MTSLRFTEWSIGEGVLYNLIFTEWRHCVSQNLFNLRPDIGKSWPYNVEIGSYFIKCDKLIINVIDPFLVNHTVFIILADQLLLGMKNVFKHNYLQMSDLKFEKI